MVCNTAIHEPFGHKIELMDNIDSSGSDPGSQCTVAHLPGNPTTSGQWQNWYRNYGGLISNYQIGLPYMVCNIAVQRLGCKIDEFGASDSGP